MTVLRSVLFCIILYSIFQEFLSPRYDFIPDTEHTKAAGAPLFFQLTGAPCVLANVWAPKWPEAIRCQNGADFHWVVESRRHLRPILPVSPLEDVSLVEDLQYFLHFAAYCGCNLLIFRPAKLQDGHFVRMSDRHCTFC